MSAIDWIFSIGITILTYFVPYIIFLVCHKGPIPPKKAKKFTIIWTIISVLLVLASKFLIHYLGGNVSSKINFFAVFVWNSLGYSILTNTNKRIAAGKAEQQTEHIDQHNSHTNTQMNINTFQTKANTSLEKSVAETAVPIRQIYNKYKVNPHSLSYAERAELGDDFIKRTSNSVHASQQKNIILQFDGNQRIFNGYLVKNQKGQVKQFEVLIFEKEEIPITLNAGDNLYYLHCSLIENNEQNIVEQIDRLTQLRKNGQLTQEEYLKLIDNARNKK